MKSKDYKSLSEFKSDIEKFTAFCNNKFPNSKKIQKSTKDLNKTVNADLKYIKMCPQCYENGLDRGNLMTKICEPPHLLVWAKTRGFNYWPAKVISVKGAIAHVIYFGEFLDAKVKANECLIYSKNRPDTIAIVNEKLFVQGVKVIYIFFLNHSIQILNIFSRML